MNWDVWFISIWISVGVLLFLSSVVYTGYTDQYNSSDIIFSTLMFGMVWPLLVAIAIVLAPIFGLYYFAKYLGERNEKSSYDDITIATKTFKCRKRNHGSLGSN